MRNSLFKFTILETVANYKVPFVCLTRNNFSLKPTYYAQLSNFSENGTGVHLESFDDREIWYPCSSINESKIIEILVNTFMFTPFWFSLNVLQLLPNYLKFYIENFYLQHNIHFYLINLKKKC